MSWKPAVDTERERKIIGENNTDSSNKSIFDNMDAVDRRDKLGLIFSGGFGSNYDKIDWSKK